MSTGLSSEFIAARKAQLEQRRQNLLGELSSVADRDPRTKQVAYNPGFPNFGDSMEDNALEITAFEGNMVMEETLGVSLETTERALKKIEDGTYGTCEKCGQLIEPKRLEAFPSATACMSCKKKAAASRS
jgi:DnaK suppressor protein